MISLRDLKSALQQQHRTLPAWKRRSFNVLAQKYKNENVMLTAGAFIDLVSSNEEEEEEEHTKLKVLPVRKAFKELKNIMGAMELEKFRKVHEQIRFAGDSLVYALLIKANKKLKKIEPFLTSKTTKKRRLVEKSIRKIIDYLTEIGGHRWRDRKMNGILDDVSSRTMDPDIYEVYETLKQQTMEAFEAARVLLISFLRNKKKRLLLILSATKKKNRKLYSYPGTETKYKWIVPWLPNPGS